MATDDPRIGDVLTAGDAGASDRRRQWRGDGSLTSVDRRRGAGGLSERRGRAPQRRPGGRSTWTGGIPCGHDAHGHSGQPGAGALVRVTFVILILINFYLFLYLL